MSVPFRLRVESGPNAGQSFALTGTSTTLGRQEGNTIVLDDARLSRQHARIDQDAGGLTVTDLGSANGTRVNGQRVSGSTPLRPGDRLQLGETTIVIEGGLPVGSPTADLDLGDGATMLAGLPPLGATSPPAGGTGPRLVVQSTGRTIPLDRPALVLGRQVGTDIVLEDTQASRQHARFDVQGGQVTLTDLGSANGTRVNGIAVTGPTPLRTGDIIQIGTSQLRVEGLAAGGATPPIGAVAPFGAEDAAPGLGATMLAGPGDLPAGPPPAPAFGPGVPAWQTAPPPPPPPGGPAWNAPPGPQIGGPAPILQPPPPPAPAQRRSSALPLVLAGGVVLLLLLCAGGGIGAFLVLRDNTDPTATPAAAATTTPLAGTAVAAATTGSTATTPVAAPNTSGSPTVAITAGSGGGNAAPPPPGAQVSVPSAAPVVPSAAPAASPTPRPSTAAVPTPATPRPSTAAAPTPTVPRASTAPAADSTFTVQSVGLKFSLPSGWTKIDEQTGTATFRAPSEQAIFVVRWGNATAGQTADAILKQELADTGATDPTFDPTTVGIDAITIGGQPGSGSDQYDYALKSGQKRTEVDAAVVVPSRFQYFFGFIALQGQFAAHEDDFIAIINSIQITPP